MSEETFEEVLSNIRSDALDILRKAGLALSFQAGSPAIDVICDAITLSYQDDKTYFTVDGKDLTGIISSVMVVIKPGQYPVFNVSLWPKAIRTVNTPDEKLGIKLMPLRR